MSIQRDKSIEIVTRGEVTVLRMNFGSANAIGKRVVEEFSRAIENLRIASARGILLTGTGRHFSSGLNLLELVDLKRDDFEKFLAALNQMLLSLFTFPGPVVAAINGHAVAGGCLLALACDKRVMADDDSFKIGLNEIDLGLPLPQTAFEICKHVLPLNSLQKVLYEGKLFTPREACEIALIDAVVEPEGLENAAFEMALSLARKPVAAFLSLKRKIQAEVVSRITSRLGILTDEFADIWYNEETQRLLREVAERLRSKKR